MKRVREILESIAFAGLKPSGGPVAAPKKKTWYTPVEERLERYLTGGATPNDPLYLSNRTLGQKVRAWSLIGVPCLILAIGIGVTLYVLEPPEAAPPKQMTSAEIAAKVLPNIDKDIKLAPAADIQLVQINVSGMRVTGTVQNTTQHSVAHAELVIQLTDSTGSQVGAVTTELKNIPASGQKEFGFPITQRDASYAVVREIIAK